MTENEKRKWVRVSYRTEVTISYGDKQLHLGGDSVNLSLRGMLAATREVIPIGTQCRVQFWLSGTQPPLGLTLNGRVVRHDPSGVGIYFDEMDIDSYTFLKEIVRHNADDPDRI